MELGRRRVVLPMRPLEPLHPWHTRMTPDKVLQQRLQV